MGHDRLHKVLSNVPPSPNIWFVRSGQAASRGRQCEAELPSWGYTTGGQTRVRHQILLFLLSSIHIYIYLFIWAKRFKIVAVDGECAPIRPSTSFKHPNTPNDVHVSRHAGCLQKTDVGSLVMVGFIFHRLTSGCWFSLFQALEGSTCRLLFFHCVYSIAKQSKHVQERTKHPSGIVNSTF